MHTIIIKNDSNDFFLDNLKQILKNFNFEITDDSAAQNISLTITTDSNTIQNKNIKNTTPVLIIDNSNNKDTDNTFYLKKPVKIDDLVKKIDSIIQKDEKKILSFSCYDFIKSESLLTNKKTRIQIQLTDKESDIINLLMNSKDNVCSKQDLLKHIWGYNEQIDTHTLETHIYKLRNKIEPNPQNPEILLTKKNGYKLII